VRPASPFVFRATSHARAESDRLADVLATGTFELDPRALAARLLLLPPSHAGETPYHGLAAVRRMAGPLEPSAAGRNPPAVVSPRDAVHAVRAALEDAVDRALADTRRVAVMTGGGVDSSALLALAVARARRVGGSAFGVALDFGGPGDDRSHCRALEHHLDCEILRVRPEDAASRFELIRSGVDAVPLAWPGGPMEIELLARARAHGADCALMGVGADELFDGDPRALAEVARGGEVAAAFASARALDGFAHPRLPGLRWVVRPLLAALLPTSLRARRAARTPVATPGWAGRQLREFAREQRLRGLARVLAPARTPCARFERFHGSPSHEHLAWLRHQEQVASGLERRDPYLDPELVRVITALPPAWLLHGDTRRGLFREAVRGLVPDSLRLRTDKASFEPAFVRFVEAGGGFAALRDLAGVPELAQLGLVEPRLFRKAFEAFVANPDDGWGEVWSALAVEAFLQTHAGRAQ
jgi:asparagine synthase (glutamine-hydrolysing)